ncbi:hypothetical protein [Corynebacterium fournieri]|uniref:hypothetical protein n=1 Tax=Corynebacterium fournieri TaxID=1852390 RepID=UPI0015C41A3C|nr:hypothetical protein [Corynebacterium fournieri]
MNYRHLLSAACATAIGLGLVAAPADAAVDPLGSECRAATAAAKAGQPIPNLGQFVFGPNDNAIDGNLLRIYAPEKYKPYITQATDQWASATGGLIRFEYVNQPGYKVVTVREADLGGYVVGRVQGDVNNMELLLNPAILRNGYIESLVMTIAHELGHAMGMAHSCDGALMKDGTNRGKIAKTPQPLDAQVLIQANNLAQYKGLPLTTTTAAPAPETSAPAETSVEPSAEPSVATSVEPSEEPSLEPTVEPTVEPSVEPSPEPSPEPSIAPSTVYVTEPATESSPEPSTTTAVVDEPEPSAPVESSATAEAKTELPKPSSLAEAVAMVRQTADEYVDALDALKQAQASGVGVDEATAQLEKALDRYAQATENRDEYVAAHPDEAVESSTSAPSQQPTSATETTTVELTTTTATTTTAPPVASVPSSSEAVAPKPSTRSSVTTVAAAPSEPEMSETAPSAATTTAAKASTTTTTPVLSTTAAKPSTASSAVSVTSRSPSVASAPSSSRAVAPKPSTRASVTTVVAAPSETAASETTTTATSTSAAAADTLASTSEDMPTSTSEHRTVEVTGEQKTTTHWVQPTLTTRPVAETTTPASEKPREITTRTIDVTVPANPQNGDGKEAQVGGSSAGILIPIIALLLGTLGAAGWAYMNGLF